MPGERSPTDHQCPTAHDELKAGTTLENVDAAPFMVWLAVVKLASQLAFGRQCCVADLRRGRFDLAGALDGLPALPGVEHHWIDIQERRRPCPPASGCGRLWDAGAAPARLARSTGGAGAGSSSNSADSTGCSYLTCAALAGAKHPAVATAQPASPTMRWRCWTRSTSPTPM
jgi:hypothetical protein